MTVANGRVGGTSVVFAAVWRPAGLNVTWCMPLEIVIAGLDPAIQGCKCRTQFRSGGTGLTSPISRRGCIARELRAVITFLDPRVKPRDDDGQRLGRWLQALSPSLWGAPPGSTSRGAQSCRSSLQGLTLQSRGVSAARSSGQADLVLHPPSVGVAALPVNCVR